MARATAGNSSLSDAETVANIAINQSTQDILNNRRTKATAQEDHC